MDTYTKIMGVTKQNENGQNIQEILSELSPYTTLSFQREPNNPYDQNAIKIYADGVHIGYISAELAEKIAPQLDSGDQELFGEIEEVTGGGEKSFGCNIHIYTDAPQVPLILDRNVVATLNNDAFKLYSTNVLNYAKTLQPGCSAEIFHKVKDAVDVVNAEAAKRNTPPAMKKKRTFKVSLVFALIFFFLAAIFLLIEKNPEAAGGACIFGVVCLIYWAIRVKCSAKKKPARKVVTSNNAQKSSQSTSPHNAHSSPVPQPPVRKEDKPIYKTEHHHVTGTSHYKENIESLAVDNPFYDSTKKELIDDSMTEEKVYLYDFPVSKVDLIEEPENSVDKNAIKVICNGVHIGYIKKGSCSHVKNLLHSNRISNISIEIYGGKYKCVYEDYDDDENDIAYTMETGDDPYHAIVKIKVKQ